MKNNFKPLVLPKTKPRNPLGLVRKAVRKHKDKRKEVSEKFLEES